VSLVILTLLSSDPAKCLSQVSKVLFIVVDLCLNHAYDYALGLFTTSGQQVRAKSLGVHICEAQD
jgi:hypothetical protein